MSYTKQLLYSIADGMGRNRKQMDPYVNVLQKNWYDSLESLKTLSINDFDRFDIPRRLAAIIMQKVGTPQMKPPQQQYQQPQYQQQYQQPQYQQQSTRMQQQVSVSRILQYLKKRVKPEKFNQYVQTITRIFRNIRENITQQKYRILKKSNQKIAQLISIDQNSQILAYGGFEDNKDAIVLRNINLGKIDDCLQHLSRFNQSVKFDPFKSQITNISGNQNNFEGQSSVIFNDKLKQEEKKRQQIMSRPIRDREIKIYRDVGKQLKPDANWNDQRELNQTQKQYADSIKEKLRSYGEDPKFMNRRKQEYYDLIKKPCFSQTLVRVKLPDNWIFQCKFAPLETLEELVKVFAQHVENKNLSYYLYMTPPVEKLSGLVLRQTFYDKGCVPRAIFYFGSDEKINGNILRQKKTGGFGFFN